MLVRLRLRQLAEELETSVMPVREALRVLEAEGLVVLSEHRGARVAEISPAEILEAASLRMWVEVHAIRIATPKHDAKSLARAHDALEAGDAALQAGNGTRFTEHNRRFHEALEAPAGPLVTNLIGDLWNRLWQVRRSITLFTVQTGYMPIAHKEHSAVFEAVAAGDAERAAALLEAHRASALDAWHRALGLDDNEATPERPLVEQSSSTQPAQSAA